MTSCRACRGFTLIELVMVIVIAGILAVGVTSFITNSMSGYMDTARRQELATSGMVAAEQISREARNALPNSVLIQGSCLEFIPVTVASTYVSVPIGAAAGSFQAIPYASSGSNSGYVAVYPIDRDALYAPSATSSLTPGQATLPGGSSVVTVSLAANHAFPTDSPTRRFFLTAQPIAYCQVGTQIFRYSNYGFVATSATLTSALPSTAPDRSLLVNHVVANSLSWNYAPATLQRNAVVRVSYQLQEPSRPQETQTVEQEIQIRNVP